jgi:hypothetical protein
MAKRKKRKMPASTTGLNPGEKMSEYPRTTVRLPPATPEILERVASVQGRRQWRMLLDAIEACAAGVLR